MLERLRLQNFQAHSDFKLKFDERVTTVVGTSDVGKSSIVRALRWVTQNKPSGDAFVREGEDRCKVSLKLDEQWVTRIKGKGVNECNVAGQAFKAFRADVPEPVNRLCNVGDVNFQQQHDSPFWFSLTAGQVSKELNAVVDLDVIDKTLANVMKELRRARSVVNVCEGRIREAEEKEEELSWVPEMVKDWKKLERLEEAKSVACSNVERAEKTIADAETLEEQAKIEVPDLTELGFLKGGVAKESRGTSYNSGGGEGARGSGRSLSGAVGRGGGGVAGEVGGHLSFMRSQDGELR
jgi:exonuclease SbcC